MTANGCRLSFQDPENVLESGNGGGCMDYSLLNHILKSGGFYGEFCVNEKIQLTSRFQGRGGMALEVASRWPGLGGPE